MSLSARPRNADRSDTETTPSRSLAGIRVQAASLNLVHKSQVVCQAFAGLNKPRVLLELSEGSIASLQCLGYLKAKTWTSQIPRIVAYVPSMLGLRAMMISRRMAYMPTIVGLRALYSRFWEVERSAPSTLKSKP